MQHASMGPRSFDRGKGVPLPKYAATTARFNGAAIFRSRKGRISPTACRKARSFNGAAISFDRGKLAQMFNMLRSSTPLQWGRDLSIAERLARQERPRDKLDASMGPRSFDRGKSAPAVPAGCRTRRFNG